MKKRSSIPYFICAFLTGNVMGALFSWSYLRASIAELFPTWSASQLSAIFSIHNIVVVAMMLLCGQLIKKVPPRVMALIGACCILIGFGAFPLIPVDDPKKAYVMMFICFTIIAASASSFCGLIMMAVYPVWVPKHMGAVTGFAVTGANISPLYYGAICSVLIPKIGVLQSVRVLGILTFVLICITLYWCRFPRPEDNLEMPKRQESIVKAHDYTLKELLTSPLFWAFFLFCGFNRGCGLIMSDLGGTIALTAGMATLLGMIFSPASAVASLVSGFVSDRLGLNRSLLLIAGIMVLSGACMLAGGFAGAPALLIIGLACGGFSYGAQMTVAATAPRFLFGNKYYGQTYSFLNASIGVGALCGIAAGSIIDALKGSLKGVYVFIAVLAVATLALVIAVKLLKSREDVKYHVE